MGARPRKLQIRYALVSVTATVFPALCQQRLTHSSNIAAAANHQGLRGKRYRWIVLWIAPHRKWTNLWSWFRNVNVRVVQVQLQVASMDSSTCDCTSPQRYDVIKDIQFALHAFCSYPLITALKVKPNPQVSAEWILQFSKNCESHAQRFDHETRPISPIELFIPNRNQLTDH